MTKKLKVLCVHGVGGHAGTDWGDKWTAAIRSVVPPDAQFETFTPSYDALLMDVDLDAMDVAAAVRELIKSRVDSVLPRRRGFGFDPSSWVKLRMGYVVAWTVKDSFKTRTRKFILDEIVRTKPDIVLGHSLGSLLTYDAFAHEDARAPGVAELLSRIHYVTLGSQLGNPFVQGNLTHGRTQWVPVRRWTHLYNRFDGIFTAPLAIPDAPDFVQIDTPFDEDSDHAAVHYLTQPGTVSSVWAPELKRLADADAAEGVAIARALSVPPKLREPKQRALLVGINDYPRESDRLEGCVNDVYLMSAALQDCGFRPDDIRLCLNERATAAGILERMEWLFDDAHAGDRLVFYYSGHGARMPRYGASGAPDRMTEMLVPWDCAWTPETIVSDEQLHRLYSQLPYETQTLIMLDCCHSGGLHRQGSQRARGIQPPDDIRHRALEWDTENDMWVPRKFAPLNKSFGPAAETRAFFGSDGATTRLFRATPLRNEGQKAYDAASKATDGPIGPYLPIIIEACKEDEFSYEYRHGVTSYGAFTFIAASLLRTVENITFDALVQQAGARLKELGYAQEPQRLGPAKWLNARIPFKTGQALKRKPPNPEVPGSASSDGSG